MKKIAIMAVLAAFTVAASAADYTAFVKYDYDNLLSASGTDLNRGSLGVKVGFGKYGAVDVAVTGGQVGVPGAHTGDQGLEFGYSNGLTVGKFGLSGRVSYEQLNETNANMLRTSGEVSYPVTNLVAGVAGFEHIRADGDALANRLVLGGDVAVAKNVTVRAAFARTNFTGVDANTNGLSLSANYKF